MRRRTRIAAVAAAGALVAAGTGVAVATTRSDDAKQREDAVLSDAAKRLDVSPSELRDALRKAEDAQLDADVKAGKLTQEQADAIKRRRSEEGTVLGGPGGPHPGGPGFFGHHRGGDGPFEIGDQIADALGIDADELFRQLRDGKTLEQIAKAEGKSLADVKQAIRAGIKEHLDEEVQEGDLTRQQADDLLDKLTARIDDLGDMPFPPRPPRGFGHP